MKKSLLALVVMGAFASAAQAQVTLYGLADVGITSASNGDDRRTGMDSGIAGASRWGIKGSEDLGGGLKAHFVLEDGFSADSGDGDEAFSRLSYVGLNGGFGTVRLGRQDIVMKEAIGQIDPFGAAGIANGHDYILGGIDQRRANTVTYQTANFGGFNATAQYNFGAESYGNSSEERIIGLRAGYKNGPLNVQFAHESLNDENGPDNDQKDNVLGATYDFGVAELHALYATRSVDAGDDYRSGMIGVSAPLGNGKIMANYTRLQNRDTDNADSNVVAVGYNYSLSKRTILTARYVTVSNDDGAQLGATGGDYPAVAAGERASVFGIGVQHKF